MIKFLIMCGLWPSYKILSPLQALIQFMIVHGRAGDISKLDSVVLNAIDPASEMSLALSTEDRECISRSYLEVRYPFTQVQYSAFCHCNEAMMLVPSIIILVILSVLKKKIISCSYKLKFCYPKAMQLNSYESVCWPFIHDLPWASFYRENNYTIITLSAMWVVSSW